MTQPQAKIVPLDPAALHNIERVPPARIQALMDQLEPLAAEHPALSELLDWIPLLDQEAQTQLSISLHFYLQLQKTIQQRDLLIKEVSALVVRVEQDQADLKKMSDLMNKSAAVHEQRAEETKKTEERLQELSNRIQTLHQQKQKAEQELKESRHTITKIKKMLTRI